MDLVELGRRWGRGALVLVLVGALWLLAGPNADEPAAVSLTGPGLGTAQGAAGGAGPAPQATPRIRRYVVHVAGAVRRPGVYKVRAPGRLIDAVRRAGGLTAEADLTQVNLAARLTDGRQIVVPQLAGASVTGAGGTTGTGTHGGPATTGTAGGAGSLPPGTKLSVNSATTQQLETLDGVGPAMAAAIIALRTKLGGFTRVEQLDEVPGVGEKRLASLKQQLDL